MGSSGSCLNSAAVRWPDILHRRAAECFSMASGWRWIWLRLGLACRDSSLIEGFREKIFPFLPKILAFLTGFAFKAVRRKESAGDLWGLSLTEGGEAKPWWRDPAWFKPFCKRAGQLRFRGTGKYGTEICFGENRTKRCSYIFKENRLPIFRYMTQACAYR